MFRTLIGFALPIASMVFLVVGPILGWERHKKKMERARSERAKSHSLERAKLVATNHKKTNTIKLTGVLNLDSTILIGYVRDFPSDGRLAPGEKVNGWFGKRNLGRILRHYRDWPYKPAKRLDKNRS